MVSMRREREHHMHVFTSPRRARAQARAKFTGIRHARECSVEIQSEASLLCTSLFSFIFLVLVDKFGNLVGLDRDRDTR